MKILCPTDFSENSEHAIEYAIHLSNSLKASLYFISSYKVPQIAGNLHSLGERIDHALHEDMRTFVNKFRDQITTGIEPEMNVVQGNTTVSILHFAELNDIDLIVMGIKGSSGIANMLMGSITGKFFEKANIPVLAIPLSWKFKDARNTILLSLDTKGIGNIKSINLLEKLNSIPDTVIDAFHMVRPEEKVDLNENTKLLHGIIKNIVVVEGTDPVQEIKNYVDDKEIGILSMVGRKHTFWERLWIESNTTSELFTTNVPILLLPE